MVGVGLNLIGQVAKTAAFSAVTGKIIDSLVVSKINKKNDHQKWIRETKLDFFTKLSQEILSFNLEDSKTDDEKRLKEYCAKTILILDDKKLILKIEDYLSELTKAQRVLIFNENDEKTISQFSRKSMDLVICLNNNLKKS